jgi:uncharacterized protein YqhQ
MTTPTLGLTFLAAMFAMYFLPAIVARMLRRTNAGAITVLNLFLGWTMIGWVVALVWAVSNDRDQRHG